MSEPRQSEARSFNEKCPRPPVPGGETEKLTTAYNFPSPALTPRRSSLVRPSLSSSYDASAPLGFEPEGSCGKTTMESDTQPACMQWAKSLHNLLHNPEGLELFRKYLDQEGRPHVNPLNFWFACEGLKKQRDHKQINELIKLIHGRFFVKSQLQIPEEVRKEVNRKVKEGYVDKQVFNAAQLEVEHLINETTYPNFLKSDTYVQYIRHCQNADLDRCSSPGSSHEMSISCGPNILPTLFEDSELISSMQSPHPSSLTAMGMTREVKLTEEILMRTQQVRASDFKRKPEAFAGVYLQPGANPYHVTRMHAQYSSYNPVSRQDSELQSVSSDARTDSDTMSLSGPSVDGMSIGKSFGSKRHYSRQHRAMRESASKNRDDLIADIVPRTQKVSRDVNKPIDPEKFARQLIDKLEVVKRSQDNGEKLYRHLQDLETESLDGGVKITGSNTPHPADSRGLSFSDHFKQQNLFIDDDNDQAILDQHVSRVWADQTPSRSPHGFASPKPRSPERRQLHGYSRSNKPRRDKDVLSTFSMDSGNIHDFPEKSDLMGAGSLSSLGSNLPKSKSVPSDYADSLHKHDLYLQGRDQRLKRLEMARRSTTKKSLTELTDSGVSGLSEASSLPRDKRLLTWLKVSDKGTDVKVRQQLNLFGSRSGSLERTNQDMLTPAQPFLGDPGMPLLPQPHTDTQLEEAKRRLLPLMEDDRGRVGNRQRYPSCKQVNEPSSQSPTCSYSNQSTLRKTKHDVEDFTVAVYTFCDEKVPYRSKVTGRDITLKQFKDILPKKGRYRYFFKTECEDLDVKVIQEEITEDGETLPLWEGKIMAVVKSLE